MTRQTQPHATDGRGERAAFDEDEPRPRSPLTDDDALGLAEAGAEELPSLLQQAAALRDRHWGRTLTYSPKVFLPLTNLCRNHCDYCAFRRSPGQSGEHTMAQAEVLDVLRRARSAGCVEALFCLGDQPETAFPSYRRQLAVMGQDSTVEYLHWAGERALELGLLPHTNAGILSTESMTRLAAVNVSLGLMLENVSPRLCEPGMPHRRAPDKRPARRLAMLDDAGAAQIPFTTGLLVGIGETARERMLTLLAIRDAHRRHGHVQEVIVQNFTPHAKTPMRSHPEPSAEELAGIIALARLVLDPDVSVQSPPNLNPHRTRLLIDAGINDFGGISPLTPDYINPDRPWPQVETLAKQCRAADYRLAPRLPIYDGYLHRSGFLHPALVEPTRAALARIRRPSIQPDTSTSREREVSA